MQISGKVFMEAFLLVENSLGRFGAICFFDMNEKTLLIPLCKDL